MTRRIPSAVALLLFLPAAPLAAQPATATRDTTTDALRTFIYENGATRIDNGRVRGSTTFLVIGGTGCELRVSEDVRLTQVTRHFVSTLDLSRFSPVVDVLPSPSGPMNRNVEIMTSDGDTTIQIERTATIMGVRQRLTVPRAARHAFVFREGRAAEGQRLLARAITACGGRPMAAGARAKLVAEHLHEMGNDPATFRLKQVCRRRLREVAGAGASLPGDSTFQTSRYERSLHFSGAVTVGGQARPFVCSFNKLGEQFELDEAKLYPPRTDP